MPLPETFDELKMLELLVQGSEYAFALKFDRLKKTAYETNGLKAFTQSVPSYTDTTDHLLRNRQCELLLFPV